MNLKLRIIRNSLLAILLVVAINFIILYYFKFPPMAILQLKKYFILLVLLILGFGVQIGLFTYTKHAGLVCSATAMASGGVSTISMILCCSHYLVNILPFISISTATFLTRYTLYILLFGIASNVFGIVIMFRKIKYIKKTKKMKGGKR